MMMHIKFILISLFLVLASPYSYAKEVKTIETDDVDIDIRVFPAEGNTLLLGFACDEGKSIAEEKTAAALAEDGIEVWMPDMLSAYMLPKAKSSLAEISTEALIELIKTAKQTGKNVVLISSGPDTELILRAANEWEAEGHPPLHGAILMFPRLFKEKPVPGQVPEYVEAVGTTRLPLILLEGERTPNRWGIKTLSHALQENGSKVTSKLIPQVRGYFFKREDANWSEDVVTSQMAGLVKVSLFYLDEGIKNDQ